MKEYTFNYILSQSVEADNEKDAYDKLQEKIDDITYYDEDFLYDMQQEMLVAEYWEIDKTKKEK